MSQSSKRTSSIIVSVFVFMIVGAFAISGYQSGTARVDSVAQAGPYEVSLREYRQRLSVTSAQYAKMLGRDSLTAKQIKDFRLKESILDALVNTKLSMLTSDELGHKVSESELKKNIMEIPSFQNNGLFDFQLYNNILMSNGLSKEAFEKMVSQDIKGKKGTEALTQFSLSNQTVDLFKEMNRPLIFARSLSFNKKTLRKLIKITQKQIDETLNDPEKKERVKGLFESRKKDLSQQEEVLASHILIKVQDPKEEKLAENRIKKIQKGLTAQNFSKMANRHTQDKSGQGKGGNLGWFGKGRMVKEFEEAVFKQKVDTIVGPIKTSFGFHLIHLRDKRPEVIATFDRHKKNLAKELIRKEANQELDQLVEKAKKEAKEAIRENSIAALRGFKIKYQGTLSPNIKISQMSKKVGNLSFSNPKILELIEKKKFIQQVRGDDIQYAWFARDINQKNAEVSETVSSQGLEQSYKGQLRNDVLSYLQDHYRVKKMDTSNL